MSETASAATRFEGSTCTNQSPITTAKDVKRKTSTHKRSVSGNIFARLNAFRGEDKSRSGDDHGDVGATSDVSPLDNEQSKARKRRGSLRKAVLGKGKQKKAFDKSPLSTPKATPVRLDDGLVTPPTRLSNELSQAETPRAAQNPTTLSPYLLKDEPRSSSHESFPSFNTSVSSFQAQSDLASTSNTLPTDSTDSDDHLQMPRPRIAARPQARQPSRPPILSTSYFPYTHQTHARSPLGSTTSLPLVSAFASSQLDDEDGYDYTPTATLGYVILVITWLVFTCGMGSCLGFWTWAWDVGETPYAPPELEDDPTLPIVGYYPALIVLTGVMAWVWVIVAWVGMKYFRHAGVEAD